MRIRTLTTGFYESHCYLIIEGNHAFLIDPGDPDLVRNAVLEDDLTLDFGILTHEHCDHVYGQQDPHSQKYKPALQGQAA